MSNRHIAVLPTLLFALSAALVSACGNKATINAPANVQVPSGETDKNKANDNDKRADETQCANPVGLTDVPANWKEIKFDDLVDKKTGSYDLVSAVFHSESIDDSGTRSSYSFENILSNRKLSEVSIKQAVTCNRMGKNPGGFSLGISDRILTKDASDLNFRYFTVELKDGTEKLSSFLESDEKNEPAADQSLSKSDQPKAKWETKLYRVSDTEIETRYLSQSDSQTKPVFHRIRSIGARYKLNRPAATK